MANKRMYPTNYKWVYKTPLNRLPYKYSISIDGTVYAGLYASERQAVIALDKKLIDIGCLDKLQVLKPKAA